MKETTRRWLQTADNDLAVARLAHTNGFYNQCVFHCQQAVEKVLKAIWIERLGETHPRTHNLAHLALQLRLDVSDEQLTILQDLADQYLPSHYADVEVEYPEDESSGYLALTSETFRWLRQLLS